MQSMIPIKDGRLIEVQPIFPVAVVLSQPLLGPTACLRFLLCVVVEVGL